jgi:hypothetical protein
MNTQTNEIDLHVTIHGERAAGILTITFTIENVGGCLVDAEHRVAVKMAFHTAFATLTDQPMTLAFSDEFNNEPEEALRASEAAS